MTLYTEEQVRKAMSTYMSTSTDLIEQVIQSLTPIELPSDEEIIEQSFNKFAQSNARTCFEEGAKWMKEQIIGKDDKTFKQKSKWTEVDNMTRRLK